MHQTPVRFALRCAALKSESDVPEQDSRFDEPLLTAILRLVPDPARYLEHWRSTGWAGT